MGGGRQSLWQKAVGLGKDEQENRRQAGDAAAARDQFAALLPIGERILGPEHPDTLATRRSLAF